MMKWLEKFKIQFKKSPKAAEKTEKSLDSRMKIASFCLEMRVDEKGLVYSSLKELPSSIDKEAYSQICQAVGNMALIEMHDKSRVIH